MPEPLILSRDRLPPQPKALTMGPQMMYWQLVENGRVVWESEPIHNLVLNQAKNQLATQVLTTLADYACVGTGNTAPAATQTALTSEIKRTSYNAAIGDTVAEITTGVFEFTRTRQFVSADIVGQNLTEWGFSFSSVQGDANLAVRELFRDGGNNPVTITPGAGQDLRLIYKFRVTVGPVTPQAGSINIAGIGIKTGQYMLLKNDNNSQPIYDMVSQMMRGSAGYGIAVYANPIVLDYNSAVELINYGFLGGVRGNWQAYTPGSKQRVMPALTLDSSQGNGTIRGFTLGNNFYTTYWEAKLLFQFDAGQEITKDNLHSLTFDPWMVSWT